MNLTTAFGGLFCLGLCAAGIWIAMKTSNALDSTPPRPERAAPSASASPAPSASTSAPALLTGRTIFWSVFAALWAFSLTAGLVFLLLRALS